VFQWGWLSELIGIDRTGPIQSFAPMMLFAILFGLSMDYEVFLISRMREEYLRTGDNATAVADGLATTARVITAAAAIMITVFASFLFNPSAILKLFGLGLATAILMDATIVRTVLVPASMELLGDKNWWFPRWLDRLIPQVAIEGEAFHEPSQIPGPAPAVAMGLRTTEPRHPSGPGNAAPAFRPAAPSVSARGRQDWRPMTGRPSQGRDVAVRPSTTPGAGVRLAVDLWGDASDPPAVFLHGAGQSRRAWDEAAATVAAGGWHAVTVDHRGHGDSEWPVEADYDFEHFAGDLDAVVGSFEQRPVVVGASLGGLAALVAQGRSTEQLYRGLVLVDVTPRM
jgi:hypothetical protein